MASEGERDCTACARNGVQVPAVYPDGLCSGCHRDGQDDYWTSQGYDLSLD